MLTSADLMGYLTVRHIAAMLSWFEKGRTVFQVRTVEAMGSASA
jgi:hypothetical protein